MGCYERKERKRMMFTRNGALFIALALFSGLLSGCAGSMRGMIRQDGHAVNIQFDDTGFGYGKLSATLPDGEIFEGKFVEESSTGLVTGFGTAKSGVSTAHGTTFAVVEGYSGNIEGVLFGNKGHTMKCHFRAVDSSMGLPSGGVGMCEVSDGRVIDVQF